MRMHMRTLTIAGNRWGIVSSIENGWPGLEEQARAAAAARGDDKPTIEFEATCGTFGSIPVSPSSPIVFGETHARDHLLGYITSARAKL